MTSIEELEQRVSVLEAAQKETVKTQKWMAETLGRIAFVQDDQGATLANHTSMLASHSAMHASHTATLAKHSVILDDHTTRLERIEADLKGLRRELPTMLADAVREGLKAQ